MANYGGLGYFLNFKDYLDYMPNLKSYLETYPQIANMATEDGALYCLNDIEPNDYVDESFFVNTTALKKLGKEIPTTWDEMLDCMRAYKKENPNGNAFITYGWGVLHVRSGRDQQREDRLLLRRREVDAFSAERGLRLSRADRYDAHHVLREAAEAMISRYIPI